MADRIGDVEADVLLVNPGDVIDVTGNPLGRDERRGKLSLIAVRQVGRQKVALDQTGQSQLLGEIVHQRVGHRRMGPCRGAAQLLNGAERGRGAEGDPGILLLAVGQIDANARREHIQGNCLIVRHGEATVVFWYSISLVGFLA